MWRKFQEGVILRPGFGPKELNSNISAKLN